MNPTLAFARVTLLALAAAALSTAECRAGLVVSVADVIAPPGSTGSFDVILTNTNAVGGLSYGIAADILEVQFVGTTGVSFTGVDIATVTPYLFSVSGVSFGVPLSTTALPGTRFVAGDADFAIDPPYEQSIAPGQSFGLAHVSFEVASGVTSGTIAIVAGGTSFSDADLDAVDLGVAEGRFTVRSAAVPAPPALVVMASGLGLARLGRLATRARAGKAARGRAGR